MRSRGALPFGVRFGYSKHSTTQMRPFSSMVNAIGFTTSRLAGEQLHLELVGDLELRDRLGRLEVRLSGPLAVVEAELFLRERGPGVRDREEREEEREGEARHGGILQRGRREG